MWEYRVEQIRFTHEDAILSARGKENWELVAISNGRFYFKRPVKQFKAKTMTVIQEGKVIAGLSSNNLT